MIQRRLALLLPLLAAPLIAHAQPYPSKPVRVIVPFAPGGPADVLARVIGQELSDALGQPFVVENKVGAAGNIGVEQIAKAMPDGYTAGIVPVGNVAVNPSLFPALPYKASELAPIAMLATVENVLVVHAGVPAKSLKELLALAKQKPGTMTYGTTGPGTIQRIATEYFAGIAGIKLVHVPYRGANETTTAILAGEIDITINGMSNILPHIEGGKLKALAISTLTRHRLAPGSPTMQEAGVAGYSSQGAFGLFAPAGVAPEIRAKIHADTAEILKRPDVVKALEDRSFQVDNVGPDGFAKMIAAETEKWAKVIRAANIKGD